MADLEDRILRQNVPGRWSSIDEKDGKRGGDVDIADDTRSEQ
jgi:hypothetical protein